MPDFQALRGHLPMNLRASVAGRGVTPAVQADIDRVMAIWRDCRERFGAGNGDFLFGRFTIADAMYAPVATRFRTYRIALERDGRRLLRDDHGAAGNAGMDRRRPRRADGGRGLRSLIDGNVPVSSHAIRLDPSGSSSYICGGSRPGVRHPAGCS